MAKVFPMKGTVQPATLPRYRKTDQKLAGGDALKSDHSVSSDGGNGQISGISIARHHTVKPSGDSGTIGTGQPLKTNKGGKEARRSDQPLGLATHKVTKPNK